MAIQTAAELAEMCRKIATEYRTLYVMGCFGAPLVGGNVQRYCNNYDFNKSPQRRDMILAVANQEPPVFGFDCVCLIKGILWGWSGDGRATYGGAEYRSNGVPDIGTDSMFAACSERSGDFSKIAVGEAVWMPEHIGIYIGDGLAVECTTKWENCVQITACNRDVRGYPRRDWEMHGKLPYVRYDLERSDDMKLPTLSIGAEGSAVKAMQVLLIGYGYELSGYDADTYFGPATDQALKAYQSDHGITPDGICGALTWSGLLGIG